MYVMHVVKKFVKSTFEIFHTNPMCMKANETGKFSWLFKGSSLWELFWYRSALFKLRLGHFPYRLAKLKIVDANLALLDLFSRNPRRLIGDKS